MKFTCLQETMNQALNTVVRAAATRATLPVTQNILVRAETGYVHLTATDLQLSLSTRISAVVDQEGAITLPARLLNEYVSSLSPQPVTFEKEPTHEIVRVTNDRSTARIHGQTAEDFPPIPSISDGISLQLPAEEFRKALARVAIAMAKDESRPALSGVAIAAKEGALRLQAADGFRLAIDRVHTALPADAEFNIVVPNHTTGLLSRLLNTDQDYFTMMVLPNNRQMLVQVGDIQMTSQLIAEKFPEVEGLIPTNHNTRAAIPTKTLASSAKTSAIFTKEAANIIRLSMTPEADEEEPDITLTTHSDELGESMSTLKANSVEGQAITIGFNATYFNEILQATHSDEIQILSSTPSSAVLFQTKEQDSHYIHVIMPMHLPD